MDQSDVPVRNGSGEADLGGVFERGRCGVPPTGATKSEDCTLSIES